MPSAAALEEGQSSRPADWILPICIILSYAVALFFASQRYLPWLDEVQLTDPGANLYFNGRFVSTVWPHQTANEVFLGNAPLFSFLLGPWFKLVGFGALEARALAWCFGILGLGVGLWIVDQAHLVARRHYPWLIALFLSSWGVNMSFWSARYDTLGLFLISLVVASVVRPEYRLARLLGRLALLAVPFAGYHLVVVCIFILALPVFLKRKPVRSAVVGLAYLGTGVVALFTIYAIIVDPKKIFFETFLSANTLPGQLVRGVMVDSSVFSVKVRNMLRFGYQDLSFTLFLATTFFAWLFSPHTRRRIDRTDQVLVAGALILPVTLSVIGKYPPYYSWIGHSCAVVLVIRVIERIGEFTNRQIITLMPVGLLTLSATVGVLPWAYSKIGRSASPAQIASINATVHRAVRSGEYVYSDFATYFPARSRARYVYAKTYAQTRLLPGFPTEHPITTMVVQLKDRDSIAGLLGGNWSCGWTAPVPLAAGQDPIQICRRISPHLRDGIRPGSAFSQPSAGDDPPP